MGQRVLAQLEGQVARGFDAIPIANGVVQGDAQRLKPPSEVPDAFHMIHQEFLPIGFHAGAELHSKVPDSDT